MSAISNIAIITPVSGGKLPASDGDTIRKFLSNVPDGERVTVCIMPGRAIPGAFNIMPIETITQTLDCVMKLCNTSIDHSDLPQVLDLLNEISPWLSYMAMVRASARYYTDVQQAFYLENMPESIRELSTSERVKWAKAKCAEYNALYEYADRVLAKATDRCEHLRTFISYGKQELLLNGRPSSADGSAVVGGDQYFPAS